MQKPYFIAEIGVNFYDTAHVDHITPLEAAKKYIDAAHDSGVDAVKFQSYKAETLASKNSPAYWDTTKEPTESQFELFKKFDQFGQDEYAELCSYTKQRGIDFMSTPFDFKSADYLDEMVDVYKISSSDITNLPFLKHIAKKGKPVYLSTGASYLSEIDEAYRTLLNNGCEDICLLHCVLSYPTKVKDANLGMIKALKKTFPSAKIGYSDHTLPDSAMSILVTAFLYGAEVIEKHFTLDKSLEGNDHYHAGDPSDIKRAIDAFGTICLAHGLEEKTVLSCEEMSRKQARRSIVLTRDVEKGAKLSREDITFKRPGTGISPKYAEAIIGRVIQDDVSADSLLTWESLG